VALATSLEVMPLGNADKSKLNRALLLETILMATAPPVLVAAELTSAISGATTAWAVIGLRHAKAIAACRGVKDKRMATPKNILSMMELP
jgi:hypothetical protein